MFDINDKNKMFAYVPSKSDLTVDNINLYSNSLIFIGDEKQIYQPLTNTYIGIGKTAYNNLFNEFKEKIDKLYIHSLSNSNNTHYFPILKTTGTGSFYYTYLSNRIGVNPDKQLFIGNLSGTSYTSSYSYIYPNSNNENLPLIFANNTNNINNTIYKDSDNSIYYNPSKNSFGHGSNVVASGNFSTAEGYETTAYGLYSHAEGDRSFAIGVSSHTEGLGNVSYDDHTHTEGVSNIAYGNSSHVEGYGNISYKDYSHVEGLYNINKGRVSHVGGEYSVAYSENSLVHGRGLISNNLCEISFGKYNISNYDTKFSIGNGTPDQRSNLFEIRENGCAYAKTFVGNLNGRARWADHATYSTYTTYTTYSLYNSYQSIHQSSLNANHYITFAQNTTYSLSYIDTDLYYNPSTNILYSNKFTGNLTGNVTGNLTGDVTGNVTGNASTATKLQTARKINGVSFDGSSDITLSPLSLPINGNTIAVNVGNQTSNYITVPYATNANLAAKATILETARKINGVSFNGSADITIAPSMYIFDKTIGIEVGNQQSSTITVPYATVSGSTTGNAATADKWKTARAFKIGDTSKNVDGSAGVTWTLDEIGVYSKATSDSRYVNVTGDTMTGTLTLKGSTSDDMTFAGNVHPALRFDNSDSSQNVSFIFTDYDSYRSPAGIKLIGNQGSEWFEVAGEMYAAGGKKVLHANNYTDYTVTKTGSGASGTWGINISGNAATADKWKTARAIKIGDTSKNVDGSAAVTWTLDEIGVYSKATSDGRYVNVDGDTMTGHLKMGGTANLGSAWDKGVIAGADGHTKVVLTYLASSTNGAVIGAHNSALSAWDILNVSGSQLIFRINETEKMRLNASGYLGIGTSSPSYPLHVNGNVYASGFIKNGSNINYVLTGDGGHKQWTTSNTANALVARDGNGYVYATYYNSNISDENNITIGSVYVRNTSDNWIRRMSLSTFVSKINEDDTKTITKSLKVTEAWMDTGITTEGGNFPKGNGTYIVQISHGHLDSGNDGYASIYSGVMTIYTGTNATDQTEEVILHRSGHASAKRLYLRTITTASSAAYCKIQIAAATAWGKAADVTFKFRKMI